MIIISDTSPITNEKQPLRHIMCEFTKEQGQQLDLNLRPSDYKSDALPLCYAGGWCWREDFFIPSPIKHYSRM